MSDSVKLSIEHISRTVSAFPSAIVSSFPDLGNAGFVDIEKMGGARLPLGALVGRSRVFEVDLNGITANALQLGQGAPQAFDFSAAVRVRYDAQGAGIRDTIKAQALREQLIIIKALNASNWPSVAGLVTLVARSGTIQSGAAVDDAGQEYEFILSEVQVDLSVDM